MISEAAQKRRAVGAAATLSRRATEPRLVACDLDGTLLDPSGSIRPAVRSAIEAVKEAGVQVVIATGRNPWAAEHSARVLGLPGNHIVMNGGAYMSPITGRLVWARRLTGAVVRDAVAFASGLGAVPLLGFLDRHVCAAPGSDLAAMPDFVTGARLQCVESLGEFADRGPIRVYIQTPAGQHARAVADAREWFGRRASIVFGDESGFEVMAPGTNKGAALEIIAESMGLGRLEVAAMGDAPNDREMLAYAGLSAALLPAPGAPLVHGRVMGEWTRVVPSSAQDGAVEALRGFFPRLRDLRSGHSDAARPILVREFGSDPEPDMGQSAA